MLFQKRTRQEQPWRVETKYRIHELEFLRMRHVIASHMRPDSFTRKAVNGMYVVRSLYFDTYDYRMYHQKMNGDHDRIKFRIRTYCDQPDLDGVCRVEMKVRQGNGMVKHSKDVSFAQVTHFLEHKRWQDHSNDTVLNEFERCYHLWELRPKVLIRYFRSGFEDRNREGVRVTFDHRTSGLEATSLFPEKDAFFRCFHPQTVILEIKCRHQQPLWMRNFVRDFGLRWVANSKFSHGIQSCRHDLIYPGGVVVVR